MAIFYKCSNNGVTAVVTKAVYTELGRRFELQEECEAKGLPRPELPPALPVFTFSRPNHSSFRFMTGSYAVMATLLEGHTVEYGGIWVPFSNGVEWGAHNDTESANWEMQYMTSLDQAIEAFNLAPTPTKS